MLGALNWWKKFYFREIKFFADVTKIRIFFFLVESSLCYLHCIVYLHSLVLNVCIQHIVWILKLSDSRLWKVVLYYLADVFLIRLLIIFTISHISITIFVIIIILHIYLVFIFLILWVLQVKKYSMYEWSRVVSIFFMNDTIALKFRMRKTFFNKKVLYFLDILVQCF